MITKRLVWVLVVVTTGLVSVALLAARDYWLALAALALGAAWLALEVRERQTAVSLFFLLFVGFAVYGSVQNLATPIMLLAVCTNLAAWDLSRFYVRIKDEADDDARRVMEKNHLQKLGVTVGTGLALGLIPMIIRLPLNFVVFAGIVLVALMLLRRSVLSLRGENQQRETEP